MALPQQFLDELRTRLAVSTVVGRKVRLTRKGHEHSGLCPFHKEKTPSFTVNDDKGFYHCFGCGAHGDIITFEMEIGNLSFMEAVEKLAAEAGLEVPKASPGEAEEAKRRASTLEVLEAACAYFQKQLLMPEGRAGKEYLERRGLDAATIAKFRLGWAPGGGMLKGALGRIGIDEEQLILAGLLKRREDGSVGEYFRERVLFPITDRRGRVIAFGGRTLGDGQPKYLNSPDTPVFHKGTVLYNLAFAREAAAKAHEVVVAEGYMDVIAFTRADIPQAVAPLGTALTETQIEELWKMADEPILCFDGDAAGQRAAARAAERALPLLKPGKSLRFAALPGGKDPDEILRNHGTQALRDGLSAAQPLMETLWNLSIAGADLSTPERRAALEADLMEKAGRISDRVVSQYYVQAFRDRLWTLFRPQRAPREPFRPNRQGGDRKGKGKSAPWVPQSATRPPLPPDSVDSIRHRILLVALITHPELYDAVGERLGLLDLIEPELDKLRSAVLMLLARSSGLDFQGLKNHLHSDGLGRELDSLLASNVFLHAAFSRPDTPTETARQGWEHTYGFVRQKELKADIDLARERLGQTPSDDVYRVFLALKRQDGPSEID